jgi:RNA polymerase sigma-70 factor, ECF subfamily
MDVNSKFLRSKPDALPGNSQKDFAAQFEQIFHENWTRIYTILYRLVGNRDEAEDLALETFWRLYNNPPKEGQNLSGWLYRVGMNLGYNALRAAARRRRYEEEASRQHLDHQAYSDPDRAVETVEEHRSVRLVLGQMKERHAQILILRYSGFSYQEMARVMEISANSVGAVLARAEKEFEKRYRSKFGD